MRIVDLTQAMANGMPVMAGISTPRFRDLAEVAADGYAMSEYTFVNHTGTHVDAPAHQIDGGATLDDIPLERLVTDAFTIDLTGHPPGPVGLAELEHHLPGLHANDIVLFSSGNALNWGSDAYWHGWCYPDAAASRALVDCGVSGVGFDGPSADPVESTDYELHQVWLGSGKIIIENMASMARLPGPLPHRRRAAESARRKRRPGPDLRPRGRLADFARLPAPPRGPAALLVTAGLLEYQLGAVHPVLPAADAQVDQDDHGERDHGDVDHQPQ